MIVFSTVSKFSPYPTFMPTDIYIYAIFIGLLFVILNRNSRDFQYPKGLVILVLYTIMVDLLTSGTVHSVSYCLLLLLLLSYFTDNKDNNYKFLLSLSFSLATFVLSLIFFSSMSEFMVLVDASQSVERVEWTDPNYFGYVIGMGCTCSIINLFQNNIEKKIIRFFLITTVILSFIVLVLNASRSAVLSVLVVAMIILLFSKVKTFYKLLASLAGVLLAFYIYSEGYMDLLMYRVQEGMGDAGGGRIYIWQRKLDAYSLQSNILSIIFGLGYTDGYNLGYGRGQGFHNDFIALLVDYGVVGFLLFTIPIIKILFRFIKSNIYATCLTLYLILCGMTVEPFTLGMMPYYLFFMYVLYVYRNPYNLK